MTDSVAFGWAILKMLLIVFFLLFVSDFLLSIFDIAKPTPYEITLLVWMHHTLLLNQKGETNE